MKLTQQNHDKFIVHHRCNPGNMLGRGILRLFSWRNYPRIISNRYHSINPWCNPQGINYSENTQSG